jgi:hypothetical protein
MAHQDYLGTFNQGQFDRFSTWATSQLSTIDARIKHLNAEIYRVGKVTLSYDRGIPTGLTADPSDSYMAKLLACYEVKGGNPFIDLRTRDVSDPVFLEKGDETVAAHTMSNGEPVPGKGLADSPSAEAMSVLRGWLETTLDSRFGRLERKIRRALDYQDQMVLEIAELNARRADLAERLDQVNQMIADPNYRAITGDTDPLGIMSYAPYSSYDVPTVAAPDSPTKREAVTPQRQQGGIVKPGQTTG